VFPDVPAGLDDLRAAGFRAVVLTNSARATGEYTLQRAGVLKKFERVLSVEMMQCYKPLPQVYHFAARELGIEPRDLMMVAAPLAPFARDATPLSSRARAKCSPRLIHGRKSSRPT
jgi:2-haloalkanoic acid dehalogenase type II